ncbi:alpha/beta fold hydrolase [Streptococcus sp. H49]|uniref:alpha/beta fold hydrolase n=1 Tax=Streptococcus huangxiaojuni TaxID=3237239 RepID=UPI0034A1707C
MAVYKNALSRKLSHDLYDYQLTLLSSRIQDDSISTSYGRTHVIETGNISGRPLLLFHGGNMSAAFNLLLQEYLFSDFHIYSVDIIGQPGKSDDVKGRHYHKTYGLWAAEVIEQLGFDRVLCHGLSFGAGILIQLMSVSPEKVEKAVLEVPSAINNKMSGALFQMALPLSLYQFTKKDSYLKKAAHIMTQSSFSKNEAFLASLKDSFDHVKMKVKMPPNTSKAVLKDYKAPVLVIAAEKDCFFPSQHILPQAKILLPHCNCYELKNRGHLHDLTDREKKMLIRFLQNS